MDAIAFKIVDAIFTDMASRGFVLCRQEADGLVPVPHDRRGQAKAGWQIIIAEGLSQGGFEPHPDEIAVDRFSAAMKAKLAEKGKQGFSGWDDPQRCHIDYLVHLLAEQIQSRAALDPVDIGNFAMMIFNRPETPAHGR